VKAHQRPDFLLFMGAVLLAVWAGGQPLLDAMPGAGMLAALTGQPEAARLLRFMVGALVLGTLGWLVLRHRALVLPKLDAQAGIAILMVSMGFAIVLSPFPWPSVDSWLHWALYCGVFLLAVMVSGRRDGPLLALTLVAAAGGAVGLRGLLEYGEIRQIEPTYRIFAGWSNPNAVASLFAAVLPVCLGVAAAGEKFHRLTGILSGGFVVVALALTQSKGGFLAGAIGVGAFLLLIALWKAPKGAWLGPALTLALGGLLIFGVQSAPRSPDASGAAPLARITSSGGESEQSAGFRSLLWRSSLALATEKPLGWGPGVFPYVSAKPGLVTQTVTAHQAYLQILVDGGIGALLGLLVLAWAWLRKMGTGASSLLPEQNILRAGAAACVVAAGAHGMVESNFSYLGVGVLVFAMMGFSLQLAADGSSPEVVPLGMRRVVALIACGAPLLLLAASASLEAGKSEMLTQASQGERPNSLPALWFLDGESSYVGALTAAQGVDRLKSLEQAATSHPNTRVLRAYARAQSGSGDPNGALTTLSKALEIDPNSLSTLWLRLQILEESGNLEGAVQAAKDLIAKESGSSFQVRSLAESVPTETYRARLWLRTRESSPEERDRLAAETAKGFAEFARLTVPVVIRFHKGGAEYAGVSLEDASSWLQEAASAAKEVTKPSQELRDDLAAIESALEALREASS
jgi:tetratricopeptide (TPR) repeat protein